MARADQTVRFTPEQLSAVGEVILGASDVATFAKRCLIWLLSQSERFTKSVRMSIRGDDGVNMVDGVHDLCNDFGIQLNDFLKEMNCSLRVYRATGVYLSCGYLHKEEKGGTLWLSDHAYSNGAEEVVPDMIAIQKIVL